MAKLNGVSGYLSYTNKHYQTEVVYWSPRWTKVEIRSKDLQRGVISFHGNTYTLPEIVDSQNGIYFAYFEESGPRARTDDVGNIIDLPEIMILTGVVKFISDWIDAPQVRSLSMRLPMDIATVLSSRVKIPQDGLLGNPWSFQGAISTQAVVDSAMLNRAVH